MKNTFRAVALVVSVLAMVSIAAAQNNRPRWAVNSQDYNNGNVNLGNVNGNQWYNSGEYEVMGDFNNPHFPTYPPPDIDPDTVTPYQPQRRSSASNKTNEQITITENKWHFMKTSLRRWKGPGIPPNGYADKDGYAWVVLPAGSRVDVEGDAPKFYRGTPDGHYLDCQNEDVAIAERLAEETFNAPQSRPTVVNYPTVAQNGQYPPIYVHVENSPTITSENNNKNDNKNTVVSAVTDVVKTGVETWIRNGQNQGQRQGQISRNSGGRINNSPRQRPVRNRPTTPTQQRKCEPFGDCTPNTGGSQPTNPRRP
jgi:hypothetical protein